MNITKIYRYFDGIFSACTGNKCPVSCCEKANRQGVEIFPDEVIYFCKKFGEKLPGQIKISKDSFTGFQLWQCSDGENCLFKNDRPLFCRCYPAKPQFLNCGGYKIFIHDKCPKCSAHDEKFFSMAGQIWRIALKRSNRSWWKKFRAKRILKIKNLLI